MRAEVARVIRGYRHASAALVGTDELPRFGPFQAVRLIGRGGMGAVYLAERADGEFRMQVAVKVVAGRFLSPVLEDNFRRERQILAGLNHPNIARLLDGGMRDGAPYLVMEYVDGLRLDQYCDLQGLGMRQRVELLGAVCRAVEYAHAVNVVHRDLKPSNILVTADGSVKLLDFGSSKLIETQAVAPDQTVTAFRGYTPEFSSPEQMEGRATGTAADVYSLGVLLAKLCPEDRRAADVTARATMRDPAQRQPSVTAFREELEQLLVPGGRPPFRWTASRIGAAIAIVALAAALVLLFLWRKKANVTAFDDAYVRLSPVGARWRNASISADGKWLAYSSDQAQANNFDIWLRGLNEDGTGRRLTSGPERDVETSISPDGRYVAFYSDRKPPGIYRIEVATGRTELLAQDGRTPKYSPDGHWIAYAGSARSAADKFAASPKRRVRVMPASGGLPVDVSEGLLSAGNPVWTRDGSDLFFESYRDNALVDRWAVPAGTTLGARELRAKGEPPGGDAQPCAMRAAQGGVYTYADGNRGKALWVAAAGSNVALRDPSPREFGGMIRDCSAARNGVIVVEGTDSRSTIWLQALDPQSGSLRGELEQVRAHTPVFRGPSLSWDGRWMTYQTMDGAIFLNDLEFARELSYQSSGNGPPVLSGDGKLLWSNEMDGVLSAKSRDAGVLRRDDQAYQASMLWGASDAGSRLLVYKAASNPRAISLIDTEANRTTTILSHPQWNLYGGNFSPDDRWVVFEAQTPDGAAIYVAPFRGSAPIPFADWILIGAGEDPKWSADGASVCALRYTDGFGCVWRIPLDAADKHPAGSAQPWVHFHGKWSPRFLVPGYFRIAAARNRMAFLLGEQDEVVWRRRSLLK